MPPDYSGQNLRGRSFKGQNLEGANFSYADIRGTNFTGANLRGAIFTGAKAGLQKHHAIFLVLVSWLLSGISGIFFEYNATIIGLTFDVSNNPMLQTLYGTGLIATTIVCILIITQGIKVNLAFVVIFLFTVAFNHTAGIAVTMTFTTVFAIALVFSAAFAAAVATSEALAFSIGSAFTFFLGGTLASHISPTGLDFDLDFFLTLHAVSNAILASAVSIVFVSIYAAWRAMKGDKKYASVRNTAVAFAAIGGTSFRGADLTDVDFTAARLKSTDLRRAKLVRTCFQNTKLLDRVRPGDSYLQNPQVRQLISTGQGQDKDFHRLYLRGINLKSALLTDTSFMCSDLSEACLQDADLSRAKLIKTQLDRTDCTGATLTGAYIQDWNITHDTNFRGVKCEYVYMRLPTKENPNPLRKPDNNAEVFADGDFADFIQPIFDTLDLYHNQGVDPRAIAISFKKLAENNPNAELEIVAMEKRGGDKFLLRAKTAPDADKSELSAKYFETYNQIKALAQQEVEALMIEKDNQISRLENMVMTALESPSFYSNTQIKEVGNMTNNQGGFSVGGDIGGDVNNVQGDNNRAVQGDNNQGVLGDNNQVTQQNQVGTDTQTPLTKEEVIELLAELEALVKGTELRAETKEEVVEDLSSAKKAANREEPNKNRALDRLGSVAETLEKTSKTVESGQKLWSKAKPIIVKVASWLGAAAGSHLLGL